MLRLAHRILAQATHMFPTSFGDKDEIPNDHIVGLMKRMISRAVAITIDGVAECCERDEEPETIVNPVPPFTLCWVEWKIASAEATPISQMGALLTRFDLRVLPKGSWLDEHTDCQFGIACIPCIGRRDGIAQVVLSQKHQCGWLVRYDGNVVQYFFTEEAKTLQYCVWVSSVAMSFMNCSRGVSTIDAPCDTVPSDKWCRRSKVPQIKYKTLVVDGMTNQRGEYVKKSGEGDLPLHITRGHFKHFCDNSPGLFGKYHGTFWYPQHLRGNKKNGVVVKDYKVVAPQVGKES